jgi:DNA-binding LacI/PurR family transcriptional regulator
MKNITQEDIAKKAKVSRTTVSLVLNGLGEKYAISKETCAKIKRISEEMRYSKNYFASALRRKKKRLIIVMGDFNKTTVRQLQQALLIEKFRKEGYDVISENFYINKDPVDILQEMEKFILRRGVEESIRGFFNNLLGQLCPNFGGDLLCFT